MTPIEAEVMSRYCEKLVYASDTKSLDSILEQASHDTDVPSQNYRILVRLAAATANKCGLVHSVPRARARART